MNTPEPENWMERAVEVGKHHCGHMPWRLVRTPNGYYSHYHAKAHCTTTIDMFKMGMIDWSDKIMHGVTAVSFVLQTYKFPTYYIGEEFIEAMHRSRLPDITPGELKMPFPAMIMGLPDKFCKNVFGCAVPYIYCAYVEDKYEIDINGNKLANAGDKFVVNAVVFNGERNNAPVSYYGAAFPHEKFSDFDKYDSAFQSNTGTHDENDPQITKLLLSIAAKAIMAASARPELIESEEIVIQKAKVKKGKEKPELWAPKWIGKYYRIKRHVSAAPGTHASPRAHWREGHIRSQPCGPQRALRKMVWIEPVLVGSSA